MTKDSGIRSLLPGVTDPEEDQLQAEAKAAVMQRLDIQPQVLPAAMNERIDNLTNVGSSVSFTPEFYKTQPTKKELADKKYKDDFEKEYGRDAIKKRVLQKIQKNKRAGKLEYDDFATHDIIIAETIKDEAKEKLAAQSAKTDSLMQQVIKYSPNKVVNLNGPPKNQKKFAPKVGPNGLKGQLMVDPKHPDGFRYTDVNDLYNNYGDNPERYIQEVMYMYEDGPVPTAGVIKPYNHLDKSSYPMNQKNDLMKYQNSFNKLTPQQKKIVENNNKRKASAVGKRTLKTKVEPEKLFENILPLK